ncbi:type III pantothenate kinase [Nonlabens ulvanivorans]|uniref:Type III pantothenate kinase n=2 Tax=Nonlabens ulvanivorans TaxID=906888 RepID=A0A084JSS6_NONUL|nr:type III pantothenate kinase [Nonlabens ulvanivorans]KEZ92010.1 transcriptional regulator, Bvg accessory factor (baf) family protein [Nonlabens ulvanivorans]PRX14838.1 type III pantothenate kinase [Nonlabens ulvanivorans]
MILVIDIGNTSIKIAATDNYKIISYQRTTEIDFINDCKSVITQFPQIKNAALCQVGRINLDKIKQLEKLVSVFKIENHIKLPFTNLYQSTTLGNDRIALVSGAISRIEKEESCLIIDAGTCVTYDYIDKNLNYHGGAISPGLRLRYESLHNFTANLPLLTAQTIDNFIGNSTTTSIHSGVINGLAQEIKGCIRQYEQKNKDIKVFMTGGDAQLLSTQLKSRFFATPFLMLEGIYYLYQFNKDL